MLNIGSPWRMSGWWFQPLWKNMSSSDWIIIPTLGENKIHVPNHQPDVCLTAPPRHRRRRRRAWGAATGRCSCPPRARPVPVAAWSPWGGGSYTESGGGYGGIYSAGLVQSKNVKHKSNINVSIPYSAAHKSIHMLYELQWMLHQPTVRP